MRSPASLYNSFQEKEDALLKFARKIKKGGYRNEDLHGLRVSVKKMRAILLLLDSIEDGDSDDLRLIKPVNSLFKKAGVLREYLLHLELLDQYWLSKKGKGVLDKYAKAHIKTSREKLRRQVRVFKPKKLQKTAQRVRAILAATPVSALRSHARNFIKQRISQMHQIIWFDTSISGLHRLRKYVRIVTTLGGLFRDIQRPVIAWPRLQYWKQMEQWLGVWHDQVVLIDFVEEFTAELLEPSLRKEWEALLQKLKAENRDQVTKLVLYLQDSSVKE